MATRTASRVVPLALAILAGAIPGHRPWLGSARAQAPAQAKPKAADADARREDRAAVRAAMQSFVKAFESGDAKALAGHWTAEGEYVGEDGGAVQGREALERAYAAFFAKNPKARAEAKPESLRFISRDSAIEQGSVTVRKGPDGPPVAARYEALLVREDGRWRLARLSESASEAASLEGLAWLVGDWKSSGQGTEVMTTYAWNDAKTFLKVHFTIKEKDRTLSGDQFLGKDPATGEIRAWTFESGGGIGEGIWNRDGDRWVVESAGTLADGDTLTATNILTKVNDDTFTWQSINRVLGEDELPDLAPVKVTRVKAKP